MNPIINPQSENPDFVYQTIIKQYALARHVLLEALQSNIAATLEQDAGAVVACIFGGYTLSELALIIISAKHKNRLDQVFGSESVTGLETLYNNEVSKTLADDQQIGEALDTIKKMNEEARNYAAQLEMPTTFIDFIDQMFITDPKRVLGDITVLDTVEKMVSEMQEALHQAKPNRVSKLGLIEIGTTFERDVPLLNRNFLNKLLKVAVFTNRNPSFPINNILININYDFNRFHLEEDEANALEVSLLNLIKRDLEAEAGTPEFDTLLLFISKLNADNLIFFDPTDQISNQRYLNRVAAISSVDTRGLDFLSLDRETEASLFTFETLNDPVLLIDEEYPETFEIPADDNWVPFYPTNHEYGILQPLGLPGAQAASDRPVTFNSPSICMNEQLLFWRVVCHLVGKFLPTSRVTSYTTSMSSLIWGRAHEQTSLSQNNSTCSLRPN